MIPGYRAIIDPAAAGLGFEALVQVTMDRQDASMIAGFERGLAAIPEIRHPERLLSGPDHLVRAATARPGLLPGPARRETRHLPGVQRLTSTIVMKRILDDRPYPPRGPRAAPATGPSHADHPDQRGLPPVDLGRTARPSRTAAPHAFSSTSRIAQRDAGTGCAGYRS